MENIQYLEAVFIISFSWLDSRTELLQNGRGRYRRPNQFWINVFVNPLVRRSAKPLRSFSDYQFIPHSVCINCQRVHMLYYDSWETVQTKQVQSIYHPFVRDGTDISLPYISLACVPCCSIIRNTEFPL